MDFKGKVRGSSSSSEVPSRLVSESNVRRFFSKRMSASETQRTQGTAIYLIMNDDSDKYSSPFLRKKTLV